jgi:hypothetical protein
VAQIAMPFFCAKSGQKRPKVPRHEAVAPNGQLYSPQRACQGRRYVAQPPRLCSAAGGSISTIGSRPSGGTQPRASVSHGEPRRHSPQTLTRAGPKAISSWTIHLSRSKPVS